MAKKLNNKMIPLVKTINTTMDAFISKIKFCVRSIPGFDDDYKNASISAKNLKKIRKKQSIKNS